MLDKLEFWAACSEYGVKPWRTTATTIRELEAQCQASAAQLVQPLYEFMKRIHGDEVGIDSDVAISLMDTGKQTRLETPLGRVWGTRHAVIYHRTGEVETLYVRVRQPIDIPGGVEGLVEGLSVQHQRAVRKLLRL